MGQCINISKLEVFRSHLRTPEVTQTREDSSKRSAPTKLEASGIREALPQHNTFEKDRPKLCGMVPPDDFRIIWIQKRDAD